MTTPTAALFSRIRDQNQFFHQLSLLLLAEDEEASTHEQALRWLSSLSETERATLLQTADTHHVVVRAFRILQSCAQKHGEHDLAKWAAGAIDAELDRAQKAVIFLHAICDALSAAGCPVLVIKSLEHWPDLGSDLDLLTVADDQAVVNVMTKCFHARILERSWGDRLAHKWNFQLPGLREAVEVHVARLGQTGEHIQLASRLARTSVVREIGHYDFRLPSPEGSLLLATLQRMYRHFYLRLCDIVDAAALIRDRGMDFQQSRALADPAGIWPGVATYLKITSDYLQAYRGYGIELPAEVLAGARFGGEVLFCRGNFLRIPIFWRGAKLYTRQVSETAFRGNLPAVLRLSLLPCLGVAAALEYRATGSDKGVW